MSRRVPAKPAAGIKVVPLLSVLICTMGAMVVLLFAFARHGQCLAAQAQRAKPVEADADSEELEWKIAKLQEARNKTEAQLTDRRLELSHVEDHERRLREDLDRLRTSVGEMQRIGASAADMSRQTAAELGQLRSSITRAEEEVGEARNDSKNKGVCYSVVPYQGPNQTRRRPIYVECLADSVVLQPEGIVLKDADFEGPLGPGNPLAAALRAAREQIAARQNGGPPEEAYPLLVVRPEGIGAYYAARAALVSWGSEFGYELVGADWKLQFPDSDPQLRQVMRTVITEARLRQQELIQAAPRQYAKADRPKYRASPHGGFVREGGSGSDDEPSGGFGMGKRTDDSGSGGNGAVGSHGGGNGSVGPGGTGGTSGFGPGGPAYAALGAASGSGGTDSARGSAGLGQGGTGLAQSGVGYGPSGNGYPAGGSSGQVRAGQPGGGQAGGGPFGGGNGAAAGGVGQLAMSSGGFGQTGNGSGQTGNGLGQPSGGVGPTGKGSGSGGDSFDPFASPGTNGTGPKQGGSGFAQSGTALGQGSTGANGSGAPGGLAGPNGGGSPGGGGTSGSAGPSGGGAPPGGNLAQTGPYGASSSGASSGGTSSSGTTSGQSGSGSSQSSGESGSSGGGSTPPDPSAQQSGMPSAVVTINANKPESMAKKRGRDWGVLEASNRRIGVTRPVLVVCAPDRLIILPEQGSGGGKEIPLGPRMQDSIDLFVDGISQHMKTWGIAGKNLYWRPTLSVEVAPGAEQKFAELKALLADSGLDVKERQHAAPIAAVPPNATRR